MKDIQFGVLFTLYTKRVPTKKGGSLLYILNTYLFMGYYHWWYMLAIILLVIGILMFGYGKLFFKFSIIQHTFGLLDQTINMQSQWVFLVIPFFMMGYGLHHKGIWFLKLYEKCEVLLPVAVVAYMMELLMIQMFDLCNNTTLCVTTYPVVLLLIMYAQKHPYIGSEKMENYCSSMALVIYFSHMLFVLSLQRLGFTETSAYLVTVVLSGMLGLLVAKTNNSILKKLT